MSDSYLLVKLNSLDNKKLPKLLALQSRRPPGDKELSKEILRHRGRHIRLGSELNLVPLEPGWYQLHHLDVTRRYLDPGTRFLNFIPVKIESGHVTYFGDFDLLEDGGLALTFRDTTIVEACRKYPDELHASTLSVPHFADTPILFNEPCGTDDSER